MAGWGQGVARDTAVWHQMLRDTYYIMVQAKDDCACSPG